MSRTTTVSLGSRLAALRAALEEGEASPDVTDFDPEAFLQELKAKRHGNG